MPRLHNPQLQLHLRSQRESAYRGQQYAMADAGPQIGDLVRVPQTIQPTPHRKSHKLCFKLLMDFTVLPRYLSSQELARAPKWTLVPIHSRLPTGTSRGGMTAYYAHTAEEGATLRVYSRGPASCQLIRVLE